MPFMTAVLAVLIPFLASHFLFWAVRKLCRSSGDWEMGCTGLWLSPAEPFVAGFIHPNCNAGGGGERVLWAAVRTTLDRYPRAHAHIYAGAVAKESKDAVLESVKNTFGITVDPSRVSMSFCRVSWALSRARAMPFCTMVFEVIAIIVFVAVAVWSRPAPSFFVDTTGLVFAYPLLSMLKNRPIISYTHYPTISCAMLQAVRSQQPGTTNKLVIARSRFLSSLKLLYYRIIAWIYASAGRHAQVVMVNSSWTYGHINELWGIPERTSIVYPPCDTEELASFASNNNRARVVLSVAQFRPEKNHELQIRAFAQAIARGLKNARLVLLGGCRDEADRARAQNLEMLAIELGIQDRVQVITNASVIVLREYLRTSLVGLHTMADEHFGIGVVEYMAAGLIPIAHDSAGPKMDIVVPYDDEVTGFLASTEDEFASCILKVMAMSPARLGRMRRAAREAASRFSERQFSRNWDQQLQRLRGRASRVCGNK